MQTKPKIRAAGCFLEYDGKFVILLRHENKSDGNTWGLPAGKVGNDETDEESVLREIDEETGYSAKASEIEFLGNFDFDFPDLFLEFPTYRLKLKKPIEVVHRPDEHTQWKWMTPEEVYALPNPVRGLHDLMRMVGY